tara:strand:+ start:4144 stop:4389 length:246 start_codon:yes stop_codon:yes gene_type:complete
MDDEPTGAELAAELRYIGWWLLAASSMLALAIITVGVASFALLTRSTVTIAWSMVLPAVPLVASASFFVRSFLTTRWLRRA